MLCYATAFVVAAYEKIRLTPRGLACLAFGAFYKAIRNRSMWVLERIKLFMVC
jgi:uncharacterized protein (DUF2461 family)